MGPRRRPDRAPDIRESLRDYVAQGQNQFVAPSLDSVIAKALEKDRFSRRVLNFWGLVLMESDGCHNLNVLSSIYCASDRKIEVSAPNISYLYCDIAVLHSSIVLLLQRVHT